MLHTSIVKYNNIILLHVYQDIPGIGFWVKKNCGPALMRNKKKNPALMVIEKNIPALIWSEKENWLK